MYQNTTRVLYAGNEVACRAIYEVVAQKMRETCRCGVVLQFPLRVTVRLRTWDQYMGGLA